MNVFGFYKRLHSIFNSETIVVTLSSYRKRSDWSDNIFSIRLRT